MSASAAHVPICSAMQVDASVITNPLDLNIATTAGAAAIAGAAVTSLHAMRWQK